MVKATVKKKVPAKPKAAIKKAAPKKKPVKNNSPWRQTAYSEKERKQDIAPVDIDKVCEEIAKDKSCLVLCKFKDLVVIAKSIQITVNKTNNNPIFQPHDYTKDKSYCIMAIIEFNHVDGSKNEVVRLLKLLNCAVFRIRNHSEIEFVLKELN
jgi:hypothetical protein